MFIRTTFHFPNAFSVCVCVCVCVCMCVCTHMLFVHWLYLSSKENYVILPNILGSLKAKNCISSKYRISLRK
jgi:hypothetical protein